MWSMKLTFEWKVAESNKHSRCLPHQICLYIPPDNCNPTIFLHSSVHTRSLLKKEVSDTLEALSALLKEAITNIPWNVSTDISVKWVHQLGTIPGFNLFFYTVIILSPSLESNNFSSLSTPRNQHFPTLKMELYRKSHPFLHITQQLYSTNHIMVKGLD